MSKVVIIKPIHRGQMVEITDGTTRSVLAVINSNYIMPEHDITAMDVAEILQEGVRQFFKAREIEEIIAVARVALKKRDFVGLSALITEIKENGNEIQIADAERIMMQAIAIGHANREQRQLALGYHE